MRICVIHPDTTIDALDHLLDDMALDDMALDDTPRA